MFCMTIATASFWERTFVLFWALTKACSYTAATNSDPVEEVKAVLVAKIDSRHKILSDDIF